MLVEVIKNPKIICSEVRAQMMPKSCGHTFITVWCMVAQWAVYPLYTVCTHAGGGPITVVTVYSQYIRTSVRAGLTVVLYYFRGE